MVTYVVDYLVLQIVGRRKEMGKEGEWKEGRRLRRVWKGCRVRKRERNGNGGKGEG